MSELFARLQRGRAEVQKRSHNLQKDAAVLQQASAESKMLPHHCDSILYVYKTTLQYCENKLQT